MKILFLALMFCSNLAFALEKPVAQFKEATHDFGTIREEEGPVTHEFVFINTGNKPLIISRIITSCGCTTPHWTKEAVLPGKKGVISAQYNPNNRPGPFNKSLKVITNAEKKIITLHVKGNVIPKAETIEENYRLKLGAVRLKSDLVYLGKMKTQKTRSKAIDIYNESDQVITFDKAVTAPDFINLTFEPINLNPKEVGRILIQYDPNHEDNLGYNSHSVYFQTDEEVDARKKLKITARITEYFPPLSEEEKADAPKLNIKDKVFGFGKIQRGGTYQGEILLTNSGKSILNVRKIKSSCTCLNATLDNYDINPGISAKLNLKLETISRKGNQTIQLYIVTNDPLNPTQLVQVKGNIITNQ